MSIKRLCWWRSADNGNSTLRSYSDTVQNFDVSLRDKELLKIQGELNDWLSRLLHSLAVGYDRSHEEPHLNCKLSNTYPLENGSG